MQPRFTIIQGGLSEMAPRAVPMPGRAGLALVTDAPTAKAAAAAGWRVDVRRPAELREAEIEEWRALAARATNLDPFADPDFLATAALHVPRGNAGGIAFALVFSTNETGIERLRGVIPLALPHPMWGGPAVALWQAPLSPRPVEPVFADGAAAGAIAALLDHLAETNPRASLRLSGIAATGALLADLSADARFRVADRETHPVIPEAQFVRVGLRQTVSRIERITAPDKIRDAIERFLLADACRSRRPLLPYPAAVSTLRVVSRLFARRGLIEVELHSAFGEVVSAAIRLGREGERMLWRSANLDEALPVQPRTADVEIALVDAVERPAVIRLVVS
ncbi:hypothetical protein [Methylobacterium haplocladii]|uniref:Uncharacterized protein n=1 Tax=Methylobacterium haplocladii TaxID=1176176 RepID=A0A512IR22_9HYPH|nr:hypothetical protein [Methylobacterium haplocladii]GEP00165.1 hypothetical protein MHA02_25520 [Methylobacterium haplocladii]GJD83780.1 hypothetical protein HPGCJGGD_1653 [Methylobacterium haplocladii]GLS57989.1 hypothetical protein GCM10007887_06450 [Methylobacterium haplocladii]